MKESVLICCLGCAHKRKVGRGWLCQFQRGMEYSTEQTLIDALRAIRNRLVCKKCGGKEIKLIELGQSEGKRSDDKSSSRNQERKTSMNPQADSESKSRCERDQKTLDSLLRNPWLYPNEMSLLRDFQRQVRKGRSLSSRQLRTIERIRQRVHSGYRQLPKVFRVQGVLLHLTPPFPTHSGYRQLPKVFRG
jgi:hypothetical protein